jgi:hypothetical protein
MNDFVVGVDLGQVNDYTAIAVLERLVDGVYHVRYLDRILDTPYPEVVTRLEQVARGLPFAPAIAVDATGVGRPVVDMLREAKLPGDLYAITITSGGTARSEGSDRWVPKREIASTIAVLLQKNRLKVSSRVPKAAVLLHELMNFRVKITLDAHDTYGAWRESDHDDLVLAVGLAAWLKEYGEDGWVGLARETARRKEREARGGYVDPKTLRLPANTEDERPGPYSSVTDYLTRFERK